MRVSDRDGDRGWLVRSKMKNLVILWSEHGLGRVRLVGLDSE